MIQAVRNRDIERRGYGTGMQCVDEGCIFEKIRSTSVKEKNHPSFE
jgi:hypothetical protein